MKKILITGANSYIGMSLEIWLQQWPDRYQVETVDMIGDEWRSKDFSPYDAVFHVAGIAHVSSDPKLKDLYYQVNRDLTVQTAQKAKTEGARQFIFMSSIIVYGDSGTIREKKIIDRHTVPSPANFYGDSKLQAEQRILPLNSDSFQVAILRPPMIYGRGSKGNYPRLASFARKFPIFPDIDNERSMLHIDNLCEFLRLLIDSGRNGLFFPQNAEYVRTSEMVRLIAAAHGKKIRLVKLFNPGLRLMGRWIGLVNKVFGNQVYEQEISQEIPGYQIRNLSDSIKATEA